MSLAAYSNNVVLACDTPDCEEALSADDVALAVETVRALGWQVSAGLAARCPRHPVAGE